MTPVERSHEQAKREAALAEIDRAMGGSGRKVVQIAVNGSHLFALCADGGMWFCSAAGEHPWFLWKKVDPIPNANAD